MVDRVGMVRSSCDAHEITPFLSQRGEPCGRFFLARCDGGTRHDGRNDGVVSGWFSWTSKNRQARLIPTSSVDYGNPLAAKRTASLCRRICLKDTRMPSLFRKFLILAILILSASLTPFASAQSGVAAMSGPFAFQLNGRLTVPGIASQATAAVGCFIADGQGNIAGEMDFTSAVQTFQALPITGTYTVDPTTDTGTLNLTSAKGTESFLFYATGNESTPPVYVSGALIETDRGPVVSSGSFYQQDPQDFGGQPPIEYWQAALTGETFVTEGTPTPIFISGSLALQSPIGRFMTTFTTRVGSGTPETTSWGGTRADSDGCGRMPLSADGPPVHMAAYIIDTQHMLVISTDPPQVNPLISGTIVRSLFPNL
jgi:hypothetical protein